jgi:hypothetical protein
MLDLWLATRLLVLPVVLSHVLLRVLPSRSALRMLRLEPIRVGRARRVANPCRLQAPLMLSPNRRVDNGPLKAPKLTATSAPSGSGTVDGLSVELPSSALPPGTASALSASQGAHPVNLVEAPRPNLAAGAGTVAPAPAPAPAQEELMNHEAEEKAKREAEEKAKREAEEKAKEEEEKRLAELRKRWEHWVQDCAARLKREADEKAKHEEQQRVQRERAKAKHEEQQRVQREADVNARNEEERLKRGASDCDGPAKAAKLVAGSAPSGSGTVDGLSTELPSSALSPGTASALSVPPAEASSALQRELSVEPARMSQPANSTPAVATGASNPLSAANAWLDDGALFKLQYNKENGFLYWPLDHDLLTRLVMDDSTRTLTFVGQVKHQFRWNTKAEGVDLRDVAAALRNQLAEFESLRTDTVRTRPMAFGPLLLLPYGRRCRKTLDFGSRVSTVILKGQLALHG